MNCPSCGSNVNQGEMFCRVCGAQITSQPVQPNSMVQPNYVQTQSNMQQQVMNNNVGYNQTMHNNYINDEELINAYIGKNADKLKYGGISWCFFFLGAIYAFYRKMWLIGIIWMIGSLILNLFLPSLASFIIIVGGIFISIQFKKWYLSHVEEEVNKIKSENQGASHEYLVTVCTQKGGTTVIPVVIVSIIYGLVFIAIVMLVAIPVLLKVVEEKGGPVTSTESGDIGALSLKIPSTLEESAYNTDSVKSYSINNDDDYCRLTISTMSASRYASAKDYLEKSVIYTASDKVSAIETKKINGNNWASMSVQKSYSKAYYYAGQKDDKIYDIEFSILDDSGACSSAHSTVINSLKFN